MARKRSKGEDVPPVTPAEVIGDDPAADLQRPPPEALYAAELARLAAAEGGSPRPKGWNLSPLSVVRFVLGDEEMGISPKFVGQRSFVERAVVALATNR